MNVPRVLAWVLFCAWATWFFALEGWLGSGSSVRWIPDLGLVLALSVLARAEVADAPFIAIAAALARAAFGPEPPLVLLTGFLGIVFFALAARRAVELSRPAWRTLAALVAVLAFDAWLGIAHVLRASPEEAFHPGSLLAAWPAAITSAILALVAGPWLAHLPGLTPIRRRRW